MERSFDSLGIAVEAALDAPTVEAAIEALVRTLRDEFELWSGCVSALREDGSFVAVATWSPVETAFVPGTVLGVGLTPSVTATAETLMRGQPAIVRTESEDFGLLADMLRAEGVRCFVVIPLHHAGMPIGTLALGSSSATGITEAHLPYFTGLGRGVEERLAALIRAELPAT